RDLQVDFQDNQIRLTGTTSTGIMDAQVEVVFEPSVAEGTLQMQIVSAKVGSLPLPERTVNALSQTVNDRIGQLTTFQGKPLKIEEVRVEDELLSITGSLK
ncbi:LmeA family phospholipid-binding protein, partial [Anaerolinea sp.]